MTTYTKPPAMESSAYFSKTPFIVPASRMDLRMNRTGTVAEYACTSCFFTTINCLVNGYTLGLCNYVTSGHMCWGAIRLSDNDGHVLHTPCVDCMDPYNH